MEQKYIATHGITNSIGLGIIEINHSDDTVNFDSVINGVVVNNTTTEIIVKYNEDSEDSEMGFMWGCNFISFSECARTGI